MHIQYHVITVVAYIESFGEMKRDHGLINYPFIRLYVNELADTRTETYINRDLMAMSIVDMQ